MIENEIYTQHLVYLAEAFKQQPEVEIYHNDESGVWLWSVSVVVDGYWLDSFDTESEAIQYCNNHKLPIRQYESARK